jgi:hypothetical protein
LLALLSLVAVLVGDKLEVLAALAAEVAVPE